MMFTAAMMLLYVSPVSASRPRSKSLWNRMFCSCDSEMAKEVRKDKKLAADYAKKWKEFGGHSEAERIVLQIEAHSNACRRRWGELYQYRACDKNTHRAVKLLANDRTGRFMNIFVLNMSEKDPKGDECSFKIQYSIEKQWSYVYHTVGLYYDTQTKQWMVLDLDCVIPRIKYVELAFEEGSIIFPKGVTDIDAENNVIRLPVIEASRYFAASFPDDPKNPDGSSVYRSTTAQYQNRAVFQLLPYALLQSYESTYHNIVADYKGQTRINFGAEIFDVLGEDIASSTNRNGGAELGELSKFNILMTPEKMRSTKPKKAVIKGTTFMKQYPWMCYEQFITGNLPDVYYNKSIEVRDKSGTPISYAKHGVALSVPLNLSLPIEEASRRK